MQNTATLSDKIITRIQTLLPDVDGLRPINHTITTRPEPADGMPVLGRVTEFNNLQIATLHSGVTMAPIVAKIIANELINNDNQKIAPYNLSRFTTSPEALKQ